MGKPEGVAGQRLGLIKQYTTYKAAQRHKLVIAVPPAYSSQKCAECGHVDAENRVSQAEFRCVKCPHVDNAAAQHLQLNISQSEPFRAESCKLLAFALGASASTAKC